MSNESEQEKFKNEQLFMQELVEATTKFRGKMIEQDIARSLAWFNEWVQDTRNPSRRMAE